MAANSHSIDFEASSSQYASRADTASLSPTGNISVGCWIKRESISAGMALLIKSDPDGGAPKISFVFRINAANTLNFYVSNTGSFVSEASSTGTVTTTAAYVHVLVTYNAAGGSCKFYIDGVHDSSGASLPTAIQDNASPFYLGARLNSTGSVIEHFDGLIDEAFVISKELSQGEIDNIVGGMDISLMGLGGDLRAYWKCNDGSGSTLADASGNGNTLTLTGSPSFSTTVPFANYTETSTFVGQVITFV